MSILYLELCAYKCQILEKCSVTLKKNAFEKPPVFLKGTFCSSRGGTQPRIFLRFLRYQISPKNPGVDFSGKTPQFSEPCFQMEISLGYLRHQNASKNPRHVRNL